MTPAFVATRKFHEAARRARRIVVYNITTGFVAIVAPNSQTPAYVKIYSQI
jgi:hypothetical protein